MTDIKQFLPGREHFAVIEGDLQTYYSLPDSAKADYLDGQLWIHQHQSLDHAEIVTRVAAYLQAHVAQHRAGTVYARCCDRLK